MHVYVQACTFVIHRSYIFGNQISNMYFIMTWYFKSNLNNGMLSRKRPTKKKASRDYDPVYHSSSDLIETPHAGDEYYSMGSAKTMQEECDTKHVSKTDTMLNNGCLHGYEDMMNKQDTSDLDKKVSIGYDLAKDIPSEHYAYIDERGIMGSIRAKNKSPAEYDDIQRMGMDSNVDDSKAKLIHQYSQVNRLKKSVMSVPQPPPRDPADAEGDSDYYLNSRDKPPIPPKPRPLTDLSLDVVVQVHSSDGEGLFKEVDAYESIEDALADPLERPRLASPKPKVGIVQPNTHFPILSGLSDLKNSGYTSPDRQYEYIDKSNHVITLNDDSGDNVYDDVACDDFGVNPQARPYIDIIADDGDYDIIPADEVDKSIPLPKPSESGEDNIFIDAANDDDDGLIISENELYLSDGEVDDIIAASQLTMV